MGALKNDPPEKNANMGLGIIGFGCEFTIFYIQKPIEATMNIDISEITNV